MQDAKSVEDGRLHEPAVELEVEAEAIATEAVALGATMEGGTGIARATSSAAAPPALVSTPAPAPAPALAPAPVVGANVPEAGRNKVETEAEAEVADFEAAEEQVIHAAQFVPRTRGQEFTAAGVREVEAEKVAATPAHAATKPRSTETLVFHPHPPKMSIDIAPRRLSQMAQIEAETRASDVGEASGAAAGIEELEADREQAIFREPWNPLLSPEPAVFSTDKGVLTS